MENCVFDTKNVFDRFLSDNPGSDLKIALNYFPHFILSSCDMINEQILGRGGRLEVITKDIGVFSEIKPGFYDFLIIDGHRVNRGSIKLYYSIENIRNEFLVAGKNVLKKDEDRFLLCTGDEVVRYYNQKFNRMKSAKWVRKRYYSILESISELRI